MNKPPQSETVWYSIPPEKAARQLGQVAGRLPYQTSETVSVPVEEIDDVEDPRLRDALHRQRLSKDDRGRRFVVPIADDNHKLIRVLLVPKGPLLLPDLEDNPK